MTLHSLRSGTDCSPHPFQGALSSPSHHLHAAMVTADTSVLPQGTHLDQETPPAVTGLQKNAVLVCTTARHGLGECQLLVQDLGR